jgi:structural hemagglutinin/hemolysin toxin protein RtxA
VLYLLAFYVPESHVELVKNAMFEKGAGRYANYACCAWQTLGAGQFIPLEGSDAFLGEKNKLEIVSEYKVEMVCKEENLKAALSALKEAHPYEEPAYQVVSLIQ